MMLFSRSICTLNDVVLKIYMYTKCTSQDDVALKMLFSRSICTLNDVVLKIYMYTK